MEECAGLVGGHRSAGLWSAGVGGEFDDFGDVGGDESAALRPGECLGECGSEFDERVARESGVGSSLEGGFDVVGQQVAGAFAADVLDEDLAGPAVYFEGGLLQVPVRECFGGPLVEDLLDGEVAVGDAGAVFDLGLHLTQALFGLGFGVGDRPPLLAVDHDLRDPATGSRRCCGRPLGRRCLRGCHVFSCRPSRRRMIVGEWVTEWVTSTHLHVQRRTLRTSVLQP